MIYRKCKKNKKIKNEKMIKRLQEINNYIDKKLDYLKAEIIDTNNIEKVSKFKGKYINILFDNLKKCNDEEICSYKYLKKRNCKGCIKESVYRFNNLYDKVKNKVNKYNQHIDTIKDIIYLIKFYKKIGFNIYNNSYFEKNIIE
ncbi:hypothetical protein [Tepidibacter formicigenes]|uniref:Uncharacterized protein n=1 Tax=Tepidibacter formicigenes DSM 15518 TaxID=1123349 RepID=A0A1M6K3D6_9FIRM|nr:hypothetical protein [Tepidibacter formicigenes]SHJ53483.1 hypothetical protein SAMN02744037_00275 [Tepidibacter formicigenes DSM 15518]